MKWNWLDLHKHVFMETNLNKMKTETYVLSLSEKLGDTKRIKTSSKMYSSERSFQLLRVFIQSFIFD